MVNIDINGINYSFPQKWSEITLKQFKAVSKIKGDDLDTTFEIVSILSDIDEDTLETLPYIEFLKIADCVKFLYNQNDMPIRYEITIDGITYKMAKDLTRITSREFFDLDNLLKSERATDKMDLLMAILFRPTGKDGGPEPYNVATVYERAELFNEKFPADLIISSLAFSTALNQALLDHFLDSLEQNKSQI